MYTQTDSAGVRPELVTINGFPVWREASTGRTFPVIAGGSDEPPGDGTVSEGVEAAEHADDEDSERVKALRAGEKRLKTLLNEKDKELEAARARLKALDDSQKSELEKAQARLAEREKAHAEAEAKLKKALISQAIERAARKHNARNPEVVAKLIDQDVLDFNEAGEPTNAEDLVKALLTKETYLVGSTSTSGVPATPRSNGTQDHASRVKENIDKLRASGDYQPL